MARWMLILLLALGFTTQAEARVKVGQTAPDFTLKTYDGKTFKLSSLKGKIVVVAFWWSNTKTPKEYLAFLEGVYKTYSAKGVAFVAVNYDRSRGWGFRIWKNAKVSYTVVHDGDNRIYDKWIVRTHGAAVLGKDFKIQHIARRATRDLKGILDKMLGGK